MFFNLRLFSLQRKKIDSISSKRSPPHKSFWTFYLLNVLYQLGYERKKTERGTSGCSLVSGEFFIEPTRECQSNTAHAIHPEERKPPTCLLKGTLSIKITRAMVPYSTLLVYTFQPTFGFYVATPCRFSVDGLFKSSLTLNATIVQVEPSETVIEHPRCNEELNIKPVLLSPNVQDRTRVKLTFTGEPGSIVGLNVVEYDAVLSGLSNNMTKERSLKHLTSYEHESSVTMPSPGRMLRTP